MPNSDPEDSVGSKAGSRTGSHSVKASSRVDVDGAGDDVIRPLDRADLYGQHCASTSQHIAHSTFLPAPPANVPTPHQLHSDDAIGSGGARNWLGETIQVLRAAADGLARDGRDGQDHRAAASAGGARAAPGPAAGRSEL